MPESVIPRAIGPNVAKGDPSVKGINKIVAAYIAATLLVALAAVASLRIINQIDAASEAKIYTTQSVILADALLGSLVDAEAGQRGFALTGDERFLQPYQVMRESVPAQLNALRSRTHPAPALKHLETLASLINARMTEISEIIELRRRNDVPAVIAIVSSAQGKQTMDSIRAEIHGYEQVQTSELLKHRTAFDASMNQMFQVVIAICLLALLLAIAFAYLAFRETQHRLKVLVHQETQQLLDSQTATNKQLSHINVSLHISEERLAVTLNSIGDAVIATDADGRVTLMNPLAEQLTGWTRLEAANSPVEEILHIINRDTRKPASMPVRESLARGTVQGLTNHTILIARNGSECDIADSCAPIRDRDGVVVGAVLVFRDVTEREHLYKMLQDRNVAVEGARSEAEKANLAKSDFLSSMSHELRTPLSAILGFTQLIESGSPSPTPSQQRSIEQILKAGWYLLELINEILDLALIESGKLSLSMEPVSLPDVMHECHTMTEPQAQKHSISVVFPSFENECLVYVKADRTRVKQVLINLLSNAIKYNRAGGKVVVKCITRTPGRIRICVEDTGEGLAADKLSQLFRPFNRLGKEASAEEGTGIGLVMTKRLVELMGGEIGVESTLGQGSTFWFELNLTEAPQLVSNADTLNAAPAAPVAARLRTVLYVEDNPANLMLVEDIIARRPDIHLLSAVNGIRGVEMARTSRPDIILMDINLPGINGIDALQILAEDLSTAHIPIVALSANAMPRDIERGLEAGFFRYLTKPIRVNQFMETLDLALEYADAHASVETS